VTTTSVIGVGMMAFAGASILLIAGFVVALVWPVRAAPDRRAQHPWEPPPDLTWDDVRELIEDADPLTRLTLERSFPPPPPVVVMRPAPTPWQRPGRVDRERPAYARVLLDARWARVSDWRPWIDRPTGLGARRDTGEPPAGADRAG